MTESGSSTSLLAKLDRGLTAIEDAFSLLAAVVILMLMVAGTVNALGRKLFGTPIWGYVDLVTLFMVAFSFLAISAMQRVGGHIRMELLVRQFSGRMLWFIELLGVLLAIAIVAVVAYYSFEAFLRAFTLGDSTIDREIPTWPSKIWVPVALGVLMARLVLQSCGYIRLMIWPDAEPIAVPLIHDVAEVAEKEIHDTFGDDDEDLTSREGDQTAA